MPRHWPDIWERFFSKVAIVPSGCWEWQAHRDPAGYGTFRIGLKRGSYRTHRVSWELFAGGPAPPGLCVLHRCDNPPCVNPRHLFLGTLADNNHDRDRKGRQVLSYGERHGQAKLTGPAVLEIRRRWLGGETQRALAAEFGITKGTMNDVMGTIPSRAVGLAGGDPR